MELKDLQNPNLTISELSDIAENASSEEVLLSVARHRNCSPELKEQIFQQILPSLISLDLTADNQLVNPKDSNSGKSQEDLDYDPVEGLWEEIRALKELGVEQFSLVGKRVLGNVYQISLGEGPMEGFDFSFKRIGSWSMKPAMMATVLSSLVVATAEAKQLSRMEQMAQELNQAGFETEIKGQASEKKENAPKSRLEQQAEELRQAGFDVKVKK